MTNTLVYSCTHVYKHVNNARAFASTWTCADLGCSCVVGSIAGIEEDSLALFFKYSMQTGRAAAFAWLAPRVQSMQQHQYLAPKPQ